MKSSDFSAILSLKIPRNSTFFLWPIRSPVRRVKNWHKILINIKCKQRLALCSFIFESLGVYTDLNSTASYLWLITFPMIQYSYLRLHGQKNFVFLGGIHVGVLVCLRKDKTRTKLFDLKTKAMLTAKHIKISYSLVNVVGGTMVVNKYMYLWGALQHILCTITKAKGNSDSPITWNARQFRMKTWQFIMGCDGLLHSIVWLSPLGLRRRLGLWVCALKLNFISNGSFIK